MKNKFAGRSLAVRPATARDRAAIFKLRHDVYARELAQHPANPAGRLTDRLDSCNIYIVLADGGRMAGFISVTPPGVGAYSLDKYVKPRDLPFRRDDQLYEIRLLTIPQSSRRGLAALALMYAAFRWVEAHGGTRIMAMGRREILGMYFLTGLKPAGISVQSGAVNYDVLHAELSAVRAAAVRLGGMISRIEKAVQWRLGIPFRAPAPCFHGGEFFSAVGEEFATLERLETVINADVLDAWFPPSPKVLAAVRRHLPRLMQTSPPTDCRGLVGAVARARGVAPQCILPGAGSSDLIFRALRHWLTADSKVLILDPTYGEYAHVLERVIGCRVDRLALARDENYRLDPARLERQLTRHYDLAVIVNPNSPTGQFMPRKELERVLSGISPETRIWVDETYIDYVGAGHSLERYASTSANVIVCKSMSKAYALSGLRVGYLCASPHQLESLRAITPPWVVGLPAQLAAVKALEDPLYYAAKYLHTHQLRQQLARALARLNWEIIPGQANFLLCRLPANGPDAPALVAQCRKRGLFLRDAGAMGSQLGDRTIRLAVKDAATNRRMIKILSGLGGARSVLTDLSLPSPRRASTIFVTKMSHLRGGQSPALPL